MADYPSIDISEDSQITPQGGIIADKAEDGSIRGRDIYADVEYEFQLIHERISSADRTTIKAHYAANKGSTFHFVAPWGETYNVIWLDAPGEKPFAAGYWTLSCRLAGTLV